MYIILFCHLFQSSDAEREHVFSACLPVSLFPATDLLRAMLRTGQDQPVTAVKGTNRTQVADMYMLEWQKLPMCLQGADLKEGLLVTCRTSASVVMGHRLVLLISLLIYERWVRRRYKAHGQK